uniref:Uncharacterized protein n=1 Tax=Serinus canaria TaxID=9135 RepID=A0A8C9N7A8_SERCA
MEWDGDEITGVHGIHGMGWNPWDQWEGITGNNGDGRGSMGLGWDCRNIPDQTPNPVQNHKMSPLRTALSSQTTSKSQTFPAHSSVGHNSRGTSGVPSPW